MIRPGAIMRFRESGVGAGGAITPVVIGGVKLALVETFLRQSTTDKDQRGALHAAVHRAFQSGERGADDALIGPACAPDDRDRAILPIMRRQVRHQIPQQMDREMQRQSCPRRGKRGELLAFGHLRRAPLRPGQHQRLRYTGQGQFGPYRGGGGGKGGHAGRHIIGNVQSAQPPHLFAHGRPDRQIARMQPRDIVTGGMGGGDLLHDLVQRQGRGVHDPGIGRTMG
jgi:hypothetical protein